MAATSIEFRPRVAPTVTAAGPVTELAIGGMSCASCAQRVSQALNGVPGVASAEVDLATGRAAVRREADASPNLDTLTTAVAEAGYEARPLVPARTAASSLRIEGMDCAHCAHTVTEALQRVAGVASAQVDLATGRAEVRWHSAGVVDDAALVAAVTAAGYRATLPDAGGAGAAPAEASSAAQGWRTAAWLGGPVTAVLVVCEWVLGLGMNPVFHWVAFALALPVQWVVGGRFYRGAWRQARAGQSNMDTLVALGSTAAFGFSVWGLFSGYHGHLYFMEAAAILTLVSVGHWLEARMSTKAGEALKSLLDLTPPTARKLVGDGKDELEVPVATLATGDRIALRPGDRVPVDAEVLDGGSTVDEAMLTGESLPVEKAPGASLFAGTVNQAGRLIARVRATGEATALAHIIAAVQRAQSSRANVQRLADRVSSVFVPIVIVLALAAALWWAFGYGSASAVHAQLTGWLWSTHVPESPMAAAWAMFAAVLIVACPCAMGLATPTALMAGVNAAARRGILIRDAQALEKSGRVTTVVFDKTGTLTQGRPAVVAQADFRAPSERAIPLAELAVALAESSQHPLARAVAGLTTVQPETNGAGRSPARTFTAWREVRGSGIEARSEVEPSVTSDLALGAAGNGAAYRLGSPNWFRELGVNLAAAETFLQEHAATGATVLLLGRDRELLGALALRDALKPRARDVVAQLTARGLTVRLVTGDQRGTAAAIAAELGLPADRVSAEVRPEQKAELIHGFQQRGERVAFVGDGLNDGPALAQADLGIAVTSATDVAKEAADILLLNSDLAAIPEALELAQATLRVIRQNLFWAFFYNAAAIPLAATGLLSPVVCAAAMGFSDVIVIGNALRLRRR